MTSVFDLTAETPAASTVHHPFGSPSGPGLFRVKGLQLPAYIQNVAHALQRSGKPESQAIQMAVGIVKRWATGTGAGGKRVHPDVQAAAARAVAEWEAAKARARAQSHSNGGQAAVSLTWNGHAIDLATIDLGYLPPHVPAGSPTGGQFGTTSKAGTNSGGAAGKTPAQQHKLHLAHIAHLQHLVNTGKASPAQKAELAGLLKALNAPKGKGKPAVPGKPVKAKAARKAAVKPAPAVAGSGGTPKPSPKPKPAPKPSPKPSPKPHAKAAPAKPKAATAAKATVKPKAPAKPKAAVPAKPGTALKPRAAVKPKASARPVVDRKKGTVTTTIGGKKVTMTLAQWHARHVAHLAHVAHLKALAARAKATGHANDGAAAIDLAAPGQRYTHGWVKIGAAISGTASQIRDTSAKTPVGYSSAADRVANSLRAAAAAAHAGDHEKALALLGRAHSDASGGIGRTRGKVVMTEGGVSAVTAIASHVAAVKATAEKARAAAFKTANPGVRKISAAESRRRRAAGIAAASDDGRFLDLAVADAITVPGPEVRRLAAPPAERVPPGVREGGQYAPRPPVLTRHDTPEQAAAVINSMTAVQRARVRATILCPPFHVWTAGDKLAVAR